MAITLIIGGARSGKSSFAEKMANKLSLNVAYIATGQALDQEMLERIKLHKKQRPTNWVTYEEPYNVAAVINTNKNKHQVFLMDCLTLLVSNILLKDLNINNINKDIINTKEKIVIDELKKMTEAANKSKLDLIVVTNELGLGIVPNDVLSRYFRDIVGRANQFLAQEATTVITLCAGIPVQIKPELQLIGE